MFEGAHKHNFVCVRLSAHELAPLINGAQFCLCVHLRPLKQFCSCTLWRTRNDAVDKRCEKDVVTAQNSGTARNIIWWVALQGLGSFFFFRVLCNKIGCADWVEKLVPFSPCGSNFFPPAHLAKHPDLPPASHCRKMQMSTTRDVRSTATKKSLRLISTGRAHCSGWEVKKITVQKQNFRHRHGHFSDCVRGEDGPQR